MNTPIPPPPPRPFNLPEIPTPPQLPERIEEVFNAALEQPTEERPAYLAQACGEDATLLGEVSTLLTAHEAAGDFLGKTVSVAPELAEQMARLKPEAEGARIGRYKLLQKIGEGGFGTVWMAEQMEPVSRRIALKIIKMGMDTKEVIARFESERQALAMMDHPNIARVFDAGATEWGRPYFVMELVKGLPITQYCDETGLGTRERLALFVDVCSAINHAHQKGVIHRDIKPSNVMVTLHGDKPVVKVIDFGIAKATQSKLTDKTFFTHFGQFIGTPAYMSPEQAPTSGLDVDTRSDIYALGVLLYELLVGRPPFDTKSLLSAGLVEMGRIIREVDPEKPSSRISTVSGEERTRLAKARRTAPESMDRLIEPDLDWIVMKAIEKVRARRYETASAFAQDVVRFLQDEPVSATPPDAGYRLRKFVRRNKVALSFAGTIGAVLVLTTAVSSWQAVRATRAERKTVETIAQVVAERDAKEQALQAAQDAEQLAKDRLAQVVVERDAKEQARKTAADAEQLAKDRLAQVLVERDAKEQALKAATAAEQLAKDRLAQVVVERDAKEQALKAATVAEQLAKDRLAQVTVESAAKEQARKAATEAEKLAKERLAQVTVESEAKEQARKAATAAEKLAKERLAQVTIESEAKEQARKAATAAEKLAKERLAEVTIESEAKEQARKAATAAEKLALQRLGEVAAERDAKELARQDAEATSKFLSEVFVSPDPMREGRSITVAEILKAGASKLESELADQPARRAKLQASIGHAYYALGLNPEAIVQQEKVRDFYREKFGAEHADTLMALLELASTYANAGRLDEALKIQEGVVPLCRKVSGPEDKNTVMAMNNLALSYWGKGRYGEALKLEEDVVAIHRKSGGQDQEYTLLYANNLGLFYEAQGRQIEALQLREELLDGARKSGKTKPAVLFILIHNLGTSYDTLGVNSDKLDLTKKGLALREEACAIARKLFGPDNFETLTALQNLAGSYRHVGRTKEAMKMREDLLERSRKWMGLKHSFTITAMHNLAVSYFNGGRKGEALKLREEAVPLFREVLGASHPGTIDAMENLVISYEDAGRMDKARKLREQIDAARSNGQPAQKSRQ